MQHVARLMLGHVDRAASHLASQFFLDISMFGRVYNVIKL